MQSYIWCDVAGAGRNKYVAFRKTFEIGAPPAKAIFHLFADTRYRLIVNGQTVCHGPARFVLSHPEYDSIDIAPHLRAGKNAVVVLVNSYNCASFHSDISVGGMICWGEVAASGKRISLESNASWKAMALAAYRGDTHPLSFALNPAEHLDARKLPAGWDSVDCDDSQWPSAVLHGQPSNWGELRERSIPMLDERAILPRKRLATFAARSEPGEIQASLVIETGSGEQREKAMMMVATWIHSPRAQKVTLGAWWGEYWLNGTKITGAARNDLTMRSDFAAELNEGWNLLMVRETWGQNAWPFYLGYPQSAGLTLSATRALDDANQFLAAGAWVGEEKEIAAKLPLDEKTAELLPKELGAWRAVSREQGASSPVRERGWRKFEKLDNAAGLTCDGAAYAKAIGTDTLVLLYDFADEVLGRMRLDFEAAAGTIVDVTFTERLKPDGVSDVHSRIYQDLAERYISRDGPQQWHQMHPRGGRYVEVLVRGDLSRFKLHGVAMTRALYPVQEQGRLDCGDPMLKDIWEMGQRTQKACMEDAYLDCPMRERGLYAGDTLVQYLVNLAAFGDHALLRRCIEIFLYRQDPNNGLVPGGAQGLPAGRHPDYSAILVQAVWQYFHHTGDKNWLAAIEPRISKTLRGLQSLKVPGSDVLDGSELHPYIDLQKMDRQGINCALNCFYYQAFVDGAKICRVLGKCAEADSLQKAADKLASGIRSEFWDEQRGAFTDRRKKDVPATEPSVAANALPLLYGIVSEQQAPRVLNYLLDAMANNFIVDPPKENSDCRATSYFAYYALGAILRYGKVSEAIAFIRKNWATMLDRGAWTCWEYFEDTFNSRCHAWSAAPTHYLSRLLLGIEFPEAGNMNKIRIAPQPGELEWASGAFPHPAGEIRVSWKRSAGKLELAYELPHGVTVVE